MRDKFNQFMQGRYGNDDLNRFLMKIILAAFVLSLFTGRIVFGGVVSLSRIIAISVCFQETSINEPKKTDGSWIKHPICGDSGAIENTKHSRWRTTIFTNVQDVDRRSEFQEEKER